jgi:hypothetical protein
MTRNILEKSIYSTTASFFALFQLENLRENPRIIHVGSTHEAELGNAAAPVALSPEFRTR